LPKLLALIMIISTMLSAGLQLDWEHVASTLRQRSLIVRALIANFVLVPLVAVLLVRAFHTNLEVAPGIVLMSLAPGVPFLVNSAGRKAGGSLAFALTISFFFAALSVITIPLTVDLIRPASVPNVPVLRFLTTLVLFQLVPLAVGAILSPRLPGPVADRAVKILHLIFLVAAVALFALLIGRVVQSISVIYGYGHLAIIICVAIFSIAVGWLLGGPDDHYRRTLSIATLMRNIGLCSLIAAGDEFKGTLVLPAVLSYFIIAFLLSLPVRIYYAKKKAA
jgi:BASS family bile acid:Na+ symporter